MSHPLRIGIDMAATAGQKSGLGFYVEQVYNGMQQLSDHGSAHEFIPITTINKNLRTYERILWDQVGLPLTARKKKIDLLFMPAFSAPRFNKPVVMTAHDIFGVIHPEQFSRAARFYWSRVLPNSMKRADHLICVSEYTKRDIVEQLGIPQERCSVVPLAASSDFRRMNRAEIRQHLIDLHIDYPFVLSVGTLETRKNYERLIEAFAHARRSAEAKLIIVGKKAWGYEGIQEKIRKYHLQDTVILLDYIQQEQLVALYNACLFTVLPSVYEGFGLPALEAMQCGSAVAVAQNTSLPEVIGEAGMMFNPYSVTEITDRLSTLLRNDVMRSELKHKAIDRATAFSWHATAERTLNILLRVGASQ